MEDSIPKNDIRPNFPTTTIPFPEGPYEVWSNELGCFDMPYRGEEPYIYLTGDSFAWGFAPFENKWGTQLENLLGIRILKCGVIAFGTKQELQKAANDLARLPVPKLILVSYFINDVNDDYRLLDNTSDYGNMVIAFLTHHSILYNLAKRIILPDSFTFPDSLDAYHEHFKNIREFKKLADTHGTKLVFVLIRGHNNYDLVRAFMEREGIPYLNISASFREIAAATTTSFSWTYDGHWNTNANTLASFLIAQELFEKGLLPENPARLEEIERKFVDYIGK